MGLIYFEQDTIARDDVDFLKSQLANREFQPFLQKKLEGTHDRPLETKVENLVSCIDLLLQELRQRQSQNIAKPVQCNN